MPEKPFNPRRPAKLGKYEILDVLGSGGMGVVYKGYDPVLKRRVAIKQLTEGFRGSPDMLARFYDEATKQASLHHNNIVAVFDAGDQDGDPYIVMQFVDGETLDKRLKERRNLDPRSTLKVVEQVCLALAYAHRKGLIHRDVKPANVIVDSENTAKLFDFGISRDDTHLDKTRTHTGVMVGTPLYMAPERFKGVPIDGRSDLFSAGVMLYELLTGKRPFDAEDVPAVSEKIMRFNPAAPSTIISHCPSSLDNIVARALAKSPLDRYATGDDMAMALREAAEELTRAQVAELMSQAERLVEQRQFLPAQSALQKILLLDSQHIAGKRLLQQVDQQITQRERERKARDLARMAQQASENREWSRALVLCEEALTLTPGSTTLISLRQSITAGKQTQEKVSQLLAEIASARRMGQLDKAIRSASTAHELDPNNSQVLALRRELEQEAEDQRLRAELEETLASFHEKLAERQVDEAASLLERAQAIASENIEVLRAKDELTFALAEERRKTLVRNIEDQVALATTVGELRAVQTELAKALAEFPNDPSLFRLKRSLEARIPRLENDQVVRQVAKRVPELPPEEALAAVQDALTRVPGSEQLLQLQNELLRRVERIKRELILAQRLTEARQLIDDGLSFEAAKLLRRLQIEGYISRELDGLLEIAESPSDEPRPPKAMERPVRQADRPRGEVAFDNATNLLDRNIPRSLEPISRLPLREDSEKQPPTEKDAAAAMDTAERLLKLGLFAEALAMLEEQPLAVKRLPAVDVALRSARLLRQGEEETFYLMGRCYAQMEGEQGVEDLKKMLKQVTLDDEQGSRQKAKARVRDRCLEIYAEKASNVMISARRFLSEDDTHGAEEILKRALPWIELAPPEAQQQVRALHAEVSGAKKLFRFGRGSRR